MSLFRLTKARAPQLTSYRQKQSTRQFSLVTHRVCPRATNFFAPITSSTQPHPPRPTIRPLTTATTGTVTMTSNPQPRFPAGSDPAALAPSLAPLLTTNGGRWTLTADGEGLEREFKFKTFAKTWDFMTAVSLQCKLKSHHPEWSNVFNTTFIRWTTHQPKGLSAQDITMAGICDQLAQDFGEVEQQQPQQSPQQSGQQTQQGEGGTAAAACGLSGLADRAVSSAGEGCCVPKKKSG